MYFKIEKYTEPDLENKKQPLNSVLIQTLVVSISPKCIDVTDH